MLHTLRFKPYSPHLLRALNDGGRDTWTEFCEWFMIMHEADPELTKKNLMDRWSNIQNQWKSKLTQLHVLEWYMPGDKRA
jgi:hypothetical protein